MRLFLAVPLPVAAQNCLGNLRHAINISASGIKWVSPESMHITLKFFGDVDHKAKLKIERFMQPIAGQFAAADVSFSELGGFPDLRLPRILWVGLDQGAGPVAKMAEAIEKQSRKEELMAEERLFHPHVTLARIESASISRGVGGLISQVKWQKPERFFAENIILFESHLTASGPRYEAVSQFLLAKPASSSEAN